jgi:peptidyl-dipeptidase A
MRFNVRLAALVSLLITASFLIAQMAAPPAATKPEIKPTAKPVSAKASTGKPTVEQAVQFITDAEKQIDKLGLKAQRASWVQENFITDDTEAIAADTQAEIGEAVAKLAKAARKFDGMTLPPDIARKFWLLKLSLTAPAPDNEHERNELVKITVGMDSAYGKGKYCPNGADKPCLSLGDMSKILANSRDPEELKKIWIEWHKVSPPYRKDYQRFVQLSNKGSKEMGFADTGAMWRSNYDLKPEEFAAEMERLWQQVKPLYEALHAYTRTQLAKQYGAALVPDGKPIPAHLFGNMWSQEWNNIYPLLKPASSDPGFDVTKILVEKKTDAKQMVRYGEAFFKSLGYESLPASFWERSLFTKPADRDVVCHASAWDVDNKQDVRLKMCIEITDEDFHTIHHELGHNYYQMAYQKQQPFFLDSANDGFHEAIGDTIALSVTPEYFKKIGFITQVPDESADIGLLMDRALQKVAFLPFSYLVDQWRWKVFNGTIKPEDYNKAWWELRTKYQGIAPPVERSEADFDAGAKYHVAGNVPYARYFLADILQFQFHRGLCRIAGYKGPLHRCSIYGNKEAGAKLHEMLAMGKSKPWPEALKTLTGEDHMDASAMLEYFAPLKKWLDEQNKGHKVGW